MIRSFIEWTEGDVARGRKVVLLTTVFTYLAVTTVLFMYSLYIGSIDSSLINLYTIFTGLIFVIYGFYTGTSSDKSSKVADKASKIILDKLKEMEKNND